MANEHLTADELRGRVDRLLRIVTDGVRPFVAARLREVDPHREPPGPDPSQVLSVFDREWNDIGRNWFGSPWRTVRGHVGELRDIRNRLAHPDPDGFALEDVERAADTARRLLIAVRDAAFATDWGQPPIRRPADDEREAAVRALEQLAAGPPDETPVPSPERGLYEQAHEEAMGVLDPRTAIERASALRAEGRRVEALAFAERAIDMAPHNIYARNALAGALRALGRLSEAELNARQSLKIDASPRNTPARVVLASILADQGSPEALNEAYALCTAALDHQPENQAAARTLERVRLLAGAADVALNPGPSAGPAGADEPSTDESAV